MSQDKIYTCDNRTPDPLDPKEIAAFFPTLVGRLNPNNQNVEFKDGLCFKNLQFDYSQTGDDSDIGDVTVTVTATKAASLLCKDWFFFGT